MHLLQVIDLRGFGKTNLQKNIHMNCLDADEIIGLSRRLMGHRLGSAKPHASSGLLRSSVQIVDSIAPASIANDDI